MIRLLLSLLALMSGLAMQGSPARALACGAHDTRIDAPAPAPAAKLAPVAAAARPVPALRARGLAPRLPSAQIAVRPGVLIGIDRAQE